MSNIYLSDGVTIALPPGVTFTTDQQPPVVIPPPGGVPTPTPPGPGEIVLPNQNGINAGVLTYPAGGQIRPSSSGLGGQLVLIIYTTIPANVTLKPQHTGFFKWEQVPGNLVVSRSIRIEVNNQVVLPSDGTQWSDGGNGPTLNFTIGNPNPYSVGAFLNFNPGDVLKIFTKNTNGENSDILFDCADPARY